MTFFPRKPRAPRRGRTRRPAWRPDLEALEDRTLPSVVPLASPLDEPGLAGYTPAQIRHAYGFDRITFQSGTVAGDGSGQTIALVVAAHDPTLAGDLHAFDQQFGLADPVLTELAQDGTQNFPPADAAWAAETALDVEWAHAIAPGAGILVVDARSTGQADLFAAVDLAARQPGVSVVSMSFGSAEDPGETQLDGHFTTPAGHAGITFVAAAGDTGAVSYPAASPNVVAVGGTRLTLDGTGNRASETAWVNGGGGLSQYEGIPDYQAEVLPAAIGSRGTPDVAYAADPSAGFAVYDSSDGGDPWTVMGGTSAGAPQWAALFAVANQGRVLNGDDPLDGREALNLLYGLPDTAFYDVTTGQAAGNAAGPGYDLATGLGSPVADQVVAGLVGPAPTPSPAPAPLTPPDTPPPPTYTPPMSSPPAPPPTSPPPPTILLPPGMPAPPDMPAPPQLPPPPSLVTPHGTLAVQPVPVTATYGTPFHGTVAEVIDTFPGTTADNLSVLIDWGDGQTSSGTFTAGDNGFYSVSSDHTYSQGGSYTITLTVTDSNSHLTETAQGTASVQAPPPAPPPPLPPAPPVPPPDPLLMPLPSLFLVAAAPLSRHARAVHHPARRPPPHRAPAHRKAHVVHVLVPPLF